MNRTRAEERRRARFRIIARMVIALLVLQNTASLAILPQSADALPASITWTDQADFEANASTTGHSTTRVGVDTASAPGDVQLIRGCVGVVTGEYHVLGLRADGTVVALGNPLFGNEWLDTAGWSEIVKVAAGFRHSVGLRSDGTVRAVGTNTSGQLGVSTWTDVTSVSAGWAHTLGLTSSGTVVLAGDNAGTPMDVSGWSDVVEVASGRDHAIGLRSDGTVVASGNNANNQCDVGAWTDIVDVDGGGYHTVGLRSNGTVVAVGSDSHGQLGVSGWTGIVAIAAGGRHTLGLRADGSVVAVGENLNGGIDVAGWTQIAEIDTGWEPSVGLRPDGSVVAAGSAFVTEGWQQTLSSGPSVGAIGGASSAVGLRGALNAIGTPTALGVDLEPLATGEAVKFGIRLSDDGASWTGVLGSDGLTIDWASGTGNYLGKAFGESTARTDLSALPQARFVEIVARLEGYEVTTPILHSVTLDYDTAGPTQYTVRFEPNGGSAVPSQTVDAGSLVATPTPDPTREGYTLAGWYADAELTNAWSFATDTVSADMTLYAKWSPVTYDVVFVDWDGTVLSSQDIPHGHDAVAPPDPSRPDHTFVGWDTDFTNVTAPLVVTALYSPRATQYTVTFEPNGGSAVPPQTVDAGSLVATPTPDPTREGYALAGWYADAELTNAWSFATDTVSADVTLYAKWLKGPIEYVRHAGVDRYDTAAIAAERDFPDGADVAIVATGENYPDALAACSLAGTVQAPILLTRTSYLSPRCAETLDTLGVEKVYVMGEHVAVSNAVEDELRQDYEVERVGGADRYATARLIAYEAVALGANSTDAFLVSGEDFPDALGVSSIAAQERIPVLLTQTTALHTDAEDVLAGLGTDEVYIAGGPRAVSGSVETAVETLGPAVTRWAGADRYETAARVANNATVEWGLEVTRIGLATGALFPDALSGGAAMGRQRGLLLLTRPDVLSSVLEPIILSHKETIVRVEFFGGTRALSEAVVDRVKELLQ